MQLRGQLSLFAPCDMLRACVALHGPCPVLRMPAELRVGRAARRSPAPAQRKTTSAPPTPFTPRQPRPTPPCLPPGVAQMCEAARRLGVPPPVSVQNDFAPVYRHYEEEMAETCAPSAYNLG